MKYLAFLTTLALFTGVMQMAAQPTLNSNGQPLVIQASGTFEDFVIPKGITQLAVEATGGAGGSALITGGAGCSAPGGEGATVNAVFQIGNKAGQIPPCSTIRFIAGNAGASSNSGEILGVAVSAGGGGGGTAILMRPPGASVFTVLLVAGGGGGAYQGMIAGACVDHKPGQGGRATEAGGSGTAVSGPGAGGSSGNGGSSGYTGGGGGGMFTSGGAIDCVESPDILAGQAGIQAGGAGGSEGGCSLYAGSIFARGGFGFGGGGGGMFSGLITGGSGGGGGGFSGGGGGGFVGAGGGGGSFINTAFTSQFSIAPGGGNVQITVSASLFTVMAGEARGRRPRASRP